MKVTMEYSEYQTLKEKYKKAKEDTEKALDELKNGNFIIGRLNIFDNIYEYIVYGDIISLIKDIPLMKLLKIKFYKKEK